MQVFHTVLLYTFYMVLARRSCLTIKSFLSFWWFPFTLMNLMFDLGVILWGEIRCLSLWGVRGLNSCEALDIIQWQCIKKASVGYSSTLHWSCCTHFLFCNINFSSLSTWEPAFVIIHSPSPPMSCIRGEMAFILPSPWCSFACSGKQ